MNVGLKNIYNSPGLRLRRVTNQKTESISEEGPGEFVGVADDDAEGLGEFVGVADAEGLGKSCPGQFVVDDDSEGWGYSEAWGLDGAVDRAAAEGLGESL